MATIIERDVDRDTPAAATATVGIIAIVLILGLALYLIARAFPFGTQQPARQGIDVQINGGVTPNPSQAY